MHTANHFYGHAQVFAAYAGVEFPAMIDGYLQHGWNLHDGFAVGTMFVPGAQLFVWSEAVAAARVVDGSARLHVIGSAWAYLLALGGPADTGSHDARRHDLLPLPRLGGPGGHSATTAADRSTSPGSRDRADHRLPVLARAPMSRQSVLSTRRPAAG